MFQCIQTACCSLTQILYINDKACRASLTPACLFSISNLLGLLCCKTDYLFCYILINVTLQISIGDTLCSSQGDFILLAALMCGRGSRSCVTRPATLLLSSCWLCWRFEGRRDSPAPVMSSVLIHTDTGDGGGGDQSQHGIVQRNSAFTCK